MSEKEGVLSLPKEADKGSTQPKKPVKKRRWTRQAVGGLILALIPLVGFLIFSGFPLIISFISLFCNIDLLYLDGFKWNYFEGFRYIFVAGRVGSVNITELFYKSCGITLWVAGTQFVTLGIALGIAVLLATRPRGAKIFQILYFIPYICSTVAVSLMWRWFFNGQAYGVLNSILGTTIDWRNNAYTMTWTIIIAIIWQAPGYGIVMYKAALANVDATQYEAAALDGANSWQKFRYVTVPGIAPTTFYLMISGVSAGLLTYDIAALMIPDGWGNAIGGTNNMGLTLMRYAYYLINNRTDLGKWYVSASSWVSWVLFLVTATVSLILFRRREKSMEG